MTLPMVLRLCRPAAPSPPLLKARLLASEWLILPHGGQDPTDRRIRPCWAKSLLQHLGPQSGRCRALGKSTLPPRGRLPLPHPAATVLLLRWECRWCPAPRRAWRVVWDERAIPQHGRRMRYATSQDRALTKSFHGAPEACQRVRRQAFRLRPARPFLSNQPATRLRRCPSWLQQDRHSTSAQPNRRTHPSPVTARASPRRCQSHPLAWPLNHRQASTRRDRVSIRNRLRQRLQ